MKTCIRLSFLCVILSGFLWAADQYEVTIEYNVPAKMRDGVILRADIYRPKADGKFPVLLERTPYNKQGGDFSSRGAAHCTGILPGPQLMQPQPTVSPMRTATHKVRRKRRNGV